MKINLIIILTLIGNVLLAQTTSPKRGFGGPVSDMADLQAVANCAWYYNWGQSPANSIVNDVKDYIDYTPMAWGSNYNEAALRTYLTNHPEVKYLLGFNEPNFIEQANLGPVAAAQLWPALESIADDFGLELVSPALNFSYSGGAVIENGVEYTDPIQYLDDFFAALPEGSRVDYIAIHGYFDNAGALPWYVSLYDKYDKPLWLTEFNHSASWVSETSQQNYMVEALDYLETEPKVFRYAWFLSRSTQENTNIYTTGETGVLTDLGLIFTNMSSYDSEYYHKIEAPIEAEHYVDMSGVHLTVVEDSEGILAAHDFDSFDWMDYQINVETTGIYNVSIRITSVWESSFSLYEGDNLLGTFTTPNTNGLETWQTYNLGVDIPLTEGNHTLRLVTHNGGWKLNWWKLSINSSTGLEDLESTNELIKLYPTIVNGAEKVFHIETSLTDYSVQFYSLSGQLVLYLDSLSKNSQISLSVLDPGLYIATIISEEGQFSQKLLVE
nr:glycosyl hydrolase [uncultured Carboxylicivirga sp.]